MSGDEIDAELLAMAGDSSDDDAESADDTQAIEEEQPAAQEPKPSVEKTVDDAAQNRRGVAQKVRKRGKKKASRRELQEELDDLRDSSPSPPASTGSADMVQSESEADAPGSPDVEDGPLYPFEGKFVSAADRDHIMSMPEIEREEILAERAQEVLKRVQDLQLKKAFAVSQAAANKHKRKATAADLEDDGQRKSSRPKIEKRSALDNYKKAREAKGTERSSRLDRRSDREKDRSPSPASNRDADGESDVEYAEPSSGNRRERDEPPADLKDFERCRIGRSNFAKVCFYPNFETAIKGCFCRVSIGMNRETGQNMYRMTQIKEFISGKPYEFEHPNGKMIATDQYALVAHGSAEKPWPFSACSDGKFTEDEFQRYTRTLEQDHLRTPRKAWLLQKLDDIHRLINMQWTDEALKQKFARQAAMEKKVDPRNQLRLKREAILKRKTEAEENEEPEEIARCDAELAALENNAAHGVNGGTKPKASPAKPAGKKTDQEFLANLNQANRARNTEQVRNALKEERRKRQKEREMAWEAAKVKEAEETEKKRVEEEQKKLLAVPKGDMSDLFGDGSDISRAGTPMSGTATPNLKKNGLGAASNGIKKESSLRGMSLLVGKKKTEEDDVLADMDLGIDVEI